MKNKIIPLTILIALTAITLVYAGSITGAVVAQQGEFSLLHAQADPIKVRPGDNLKVLVEIDSDNKIESAIAKFNHEKGFDQVPMMLIAAANGRQTFSANWEVHSTLDQVWYTTDFEIIDTFGNVLSGSVDWQDPTVSHGAEQVNPGSFQNGSYTFPGTTTLTTVACASGECISGSLVDESGLTCAEITGSSALCDGSDATGISSESDPQVGSVGTNNMCRGDGSQVQCNIYTVDGSGNLELGFNNLEISGANQGIFLQGTLQAMTSNGNLQIGTGYGAVEIRPQAGGNRVGISTPGASAGSVVCKLSGGEFAFVGVCSSGVTGSGTCTCV